MEAKKEEEREEKRRKRGRKRKEPLDVGAVSATVYMRPVDRGCTN